MNFPKPLGAVFSMVMLVLASGPAGANDDFAQRRILPSQETVEYSMRTPATISYENLDPLKRDANGYQISGTGSVWFEWTAPSTGIFKTGAVDPDNNVIDVLVWEGASLERMVRVQNGNEDIVAWNRGTVFAARQGQRYQLGMRVPRDSQSSRGLGTLRIGPAAPVPVNDTLAKRAVLSGTGPVTIRGTNFSPVSEEAYRLNLMTALGGRPYAYGYYGPAYWWEWKCPESGIYEFKTELMPWVLIAKRMVHEDGGTTPGDWDFMPMLSDMCFEAEEGRVYDIALTSDRPPFSVNSYGEFSFTMQRSPALNPLNISRATAKELPQTLPSEYAELWPGGRMESGEPNVALWYSFTTPADGYYAFDFYGYWPVMERIGTDGEPQSLSYAFQYLSKGERIYFVYNMPARAPQPLRIAVRAVPARPVADNRANALDLGTAAEFSLLGRAGEATLEPEDAFDDGYSATLTGTLWWRWTAPGDGWLTIKDGASISVYLHVVRAGEPDENVLQLEPSEVTAGNSYLIRAGFAEQEHLRTLAATLLYIPALTNFSWQTATDLGTPRLPRFQPSPHTPSVTVSGESWFRWTAPETLRAGLTGSFTGLNMNIYTDPASNTPMERDEASWTWEFTAGRTYWLRYPFITSQPAFEFEHAPLTAHGDISSALVLDSTLPCGGVVATRGDRNSDAERAALPWAGTYNPIVWWKWQPKSRQDVRLRVDSFEGYAPSDVAVFSGTPSGPETLVDEIIPREQTDTGFPVRYFSVEPGQTIWIAVVGFEYSQTYVQHLRAELREVVRSGPVNDDFSGRTELASNAWVTGSAVFGTHRADNNYHPLRYEVAAASLEAGEPPVSLIVGQDGNVQAQTATTWWQWTAPGDGIYRIDLHEAWAGGFSHGGADDLTLDVYTGESLASLQAQALYEPSLGVYVFRAEGGTRYVLRVASGSARYFYAMEPLVPQPEDYFDYWAIENLRFEDVGQAWTSHAGDGISNYLKLVFGFDLMLPVDHPANAAARERLPRQSISAGFLEMRCRPLVDFAPAGDTANFGFYGTYSANLRDWQEMSPLSLAGGELVLRVPASGPRTFLKWDILTKFSD